MRWSVMLGSLLDAFPLSAETDSVTRAFDRCLNFDLFDFLERKFLAGAIVEFWRGDSWFPMVWASPRVQSYRRKDFTQETTQKGKFGSSGTEELPEGLSCGSL
jgi:hypothetical protein